MDGTEDLDLLEQELADVEAALACLAQPGDEVCATCRAARVDGTLEQRRALAACAAHRPPAEVAVDA